MTGIMSLSNTNSCAEEGIIKLPRSFTFTLQLLSVLHYVVHLLI